MRQRRFHNLQPATLISNMMNEGEWIDVSFSKDGGVQKKILKEAPQGASGPPPKGFEVEAHYTGMSDAICLFDILASEAHLSPFSLL